jgi:alpha-tubulin suppressor-like RCC1 family protein
MPYEPITNFEDSNGVDLGKKLVTRDYLLTVYGTILNSLGNSELTVSPNLWSWGDNRFGQLGVNDIVTRSIPITTILGGTNWEIVAGGGGHTAAVKIDGTLWTWGINTFGQLGTNNTTSTSTPVTTILGGTNWKTVACGENHTIAVKTDGTLWLWGRNSYGALGINVIAARSTPVTTLLGGTNWNSIAGGRHHTAATKLDGTLWTIGNNTQGTLGINSNAHKSTPVTTILGGTNWKSVSCGIGHVMALKTDGTLWGWGRNDSGQVGTNNVTVRSTPVTTILGGTNWKTVASGGYHTSCIKTDGTLWVWGDNLYGQLGVNNITDRNTPVTTILGGNNWKLIDCGQFHKASIKTDGTLWTWGRNDQGQLGINNIDGRSIPVTTILGGSDWKLVGCGSTHTVTVRSDATI